MDELRTAVLFHCQVSPLSQGGEEWGSAWQEAEPDHYLLMEKSIKSLPLQNAF